MASLNPPNPSEPPSGEAPRRPFRLARGILIGLVGAVALFFVARIGGGLLPVAVTWVDGLGYWGPLVFIVLYALATVLFIPGSILTLAGGALFGWASGVVYVFLAAVLGSSVAFLIARYGARGWVEERLGSSPRFEALDRAVGDEGLKITFLLRLSPVFPFNFLNYALGLTRVSLRDYLIASVGMLPVTFLYVYSGQVIGDVASLAGGASPERGTGYYGVLALGLGATLAVTTVVTRTARRALAGATELHSLTQPLTQPPTQPESE
jgi:uncharacterized membrane protein YdjX (TVP38/TMEM64 family)